MKLALWLLLLLWLPGNAAEIELKTTDGERVFGTLTVAREGNDRICLLFHQARSNRHEYDPIVPELVKLGFDTLAIDQRSGDTMWGKKNETVVARGNKATKYLPVLADLQAALDWVVAKQQYKITVAVGSSYAGTLCFLLAADNPDKLTAIACFSPGEYLRGKTVAEAASGLRLPIYVTGGSAPIEQKNIDAILGEQDLPNVTRHRPTTGRHGAAILRPDQNPKGAKDSWTAFAAFLKKLGEAGPAPPAKEESP